MALESLNELNVQLELDINVGDVNFNKEFVKMVDSYLKNNISMNASALHSYSKLFKRSVARGRIKVQPGAVRAGKSRTPAKRTLRFRTV